MPADRPFRFGATAGKAPSASAWRDLARRVEDHGYSTLFLPDHLNDQLSPLPALAVAAEATRALRVGPLVLCNDFRHPVVAAKDLATLDLLTDGRVEWGMGAGWFTFDYESTALPFDEPRVRVDRLEEAVGIMKRLFEGEPFDHAGDHYAITGLAGTPRPVQRPHPPLTIGGARTRILRLAGREADVVGLQPSTDSRTLGSRPPLLSVADATDRQLGWVREAAGDRFDALEIQAVAFPAAVGDVREEQVQNLSKAFGLAPPEVLASPHILLGSVDEICERLEERRSRWGISYWVVAAGSVDAFAPVVARLAGR